MPETTKDLQTMAAHSKTKPEVPDSEVQESARNYGATEESYEKAIEFLIGADNCKGIIC